MSAGFYPNSKSLNPGIRTIYRYIADNKMQEPEFWETTGGLALHHLITALSANDFAALESDLGNWDEAEQNILTDCVAYGIDGKFGSPYDNEQRVSGMRLYGQLQNGFSHPELKKWRKNHKVHSKTKSKNPRVLFVYDYLLENEYTDSDFWSLGSGSDELQRRLNKFGKPDWEELKKDIFNWSEDDRNMLIESIGFGWDKGYPTCFNDEVIPGAGDFLLDMFILIEDPDVRLDIAASSLLINRSGTKQFEKLNFMKEWMSENGFRQDEWRHSAVNPMAYIDEAMEKAGR